MKKISYYLIFIVIIGGLLTSLWVWQKYFKEEESRLLLFNVERGSVQEVVKVRGEVASQKELDLEFPFSGTIEGVFVKEGEEIEKNKPLMKLETTDFELELKRLKAVLEQNQANLTKLKSGATLEEIKILETKVANAGKTLNDANRNLADTQDKARVDLKSKEDSLENAKINLTNVKNKAEVDLASAYGDVLDILNDAYLNADDALHQQIDNLFINDDTSAPELTFSTSNKTAQNSSISQRMSSSSELKSFQSEIVGLNSSDYNNLDQAQTNAKSHLNVIQNLLETLMETINSSTGLAQATINTYKTNINTARTNINTSLASITNQQQTIAAQKATNQSLITTAETKVIDDENTLATQKIVNQNKITLAQTDVNNAENSLTLAKDNLNLEKTGTRDEDIDIARAKIKEIESQIAATKEKIRKSTISAPTLARVVKVWLENKESFKIGQTAISLSVSGHKIQADVSELEIGKVREVDGNDVLVKLDAFPNQGFGGKVVSIEPKEIIKNEDKYYRVNVYLEEYGKTIRPGMSADLIIKIFSKDNVIKIPELAIYPKNDKRFVKVLEGDSQRETEIETGIFDGESIEVTKGLSEGQTIVVSAD